MNNKDNNIYQHYKNMFFYMYYYVLNNMLNYQSPDSALTLLYTTKRDL